MLDEGSTRPSVRITHTIGVKVEKYIFRARLNCGIRLRRVDSCPGGTLVIPCAPSRLVDPIAVYTDKAETSPHLPPLPK